MIEIPKRYMKWERKPWPDEPVIEFDTVYRGCAVAVWHRNDRWHWLAEGPTGPAVTKSGEGATRVEVELAAFAAVNNELAVVRLVSGT